MKFTCEEGQANGATEWQIKKDGAADVKEKNANKAMAAPLDYSDDKLGSGVYTCVAHKAMKHATSDAIELQDESVGKS